MSRLAKNGKEIICEVKSFYIVSIIDIMVGKLDKRGEEGKVIANVIPKKTVPAGTKICLRIAFKKKNGNLLAYGHGFGWFEMDDISKFFDTSKYNEEDFNKLIFKDYSNISLNEKAKLIAKYSKIENLTKTEKMLLAYLQGKSLNEVEKEIQVDKSLKYKIKNNTEEYATKFINKFEHLIA